ncbi:related to oligo-1,6-glucosidase [Cephalotrichum gorgonifer]|uniref:Related to oligo-1,6-glucosidase n=1 Tax=Cephalotrichum gorgonifer TaxID=2041049 RepID=A0AAE8SY33_9PEZI|nr:related to oligo-1,6-glucosidase [Cephalotrichum gorgonifer]
MSGVAKPLDRQWWKESVVYQVYPSSFLDTDGDGIGNINGITSKLDYLKELGVDILWLTPIYESPQMDMGYDIANYKAIHPPYGTMEDVERLISELKSRDMKLVMDLVVNHTSHKHAWFLDSSSSKQSPKRSWYIWRPARYDEDGTRHPPNNWACILDEANSAWTWDPETEEYFLSLFTPYQPDLNWENPDVREAVYDILRFWIDKGTAGFRMDVINLISKDQSFADAEVADVSRPYQDGRKFYANGPKLLDYLQEMKREVLSKQDLITVGEMPFLDDEDKILEIVKANEGPLNMIFTFELMALDEIPGKGKFSFRNWAVSDMSAIIQKMSRVVANGGWSSLYLENHDQIRSVSRFCDDSDEHRVAGSKLLCIMQTTLTGTLYVYQGEELGMRNVPLSWDPEEYKDIESVSYWKYLRSKYPTGSEELRKAKELHNRKARDNGRTPVQWDDSPNAGFCAADVKPWMRVNDDYPTVNAKAQLASGRATPASDSVSPYRFWQRALQVRKAHVDLLYGGFEIIGDTDPNVFAYKRTGGGQVSVTILNFSGEEAEFHLAEGLKVDNWVLGSYDTSSAEKPKEGVIKLRPWEGLLGVGRE